MESSSEEKSSLEQNFQVEYVILYSFKGADQPKAARQFKQLIHALSGAGLQTAVRNGSGSSLLVFVRAPEKQLNAAVKKSRVKDWLYGVRHTQPGVDQKEPEGPETNGEHLRAVYYMITLPKRKGGAGITPKTGDWEYVDSIFPLHDHELNKQWMKSWSRKTFLSPEELDQIRERLGEQVAFYFAFLQSYFAFLMAPAALGFACWVLLGQYSVVYSVGNSLACMFFVEYWKREEGDLALRWHVKGVSAIMSKRREFKPEKTVTDPITGEEVAVFPVRKRLLRQLLRVPFSLVSTLALGTLIAACFALEIFLSELYSGPFKSVLVFLPTVLLSLLVPTITKFLTKIATWLNDFENYETQEQYDVALTRKIFVLDFITSYLPVLLTAFVYLPFAHVLVPYLDVIHWFVKPVYSDPKKAANPAKSGFSTNRAKLRGRVVYFAITGQVVNFAMETVVPYVQRKFLRKYQEMSEDKKSKNGDSSSGKSEEAPEGFNEPPGEEKFLKGVRNEAELTEYGVTGDLREMCVQFGYLALFSPVWPLVPVFFLLNNWVELRSDFFKICVECKRPNPLRADTIGPWLDSMSFLAWLGSITSAALVYLFGAHDGVGINVEEGSSVKGWALLLAIFFAEHGYLLVRMAVSFAMTKMDTRETRREKAERFMLRKSYLRASQNEDSQQEQEQGRPSTQGSDPARADREFSRKSLEEEARNLSTHTSTKSDVFWSRQKGWKETAQVGVTAIMQAPSQASPEAKKEQ